MSKKKNRDERIEEVIKEVTEVNEVVENEELETETEEETAEIVLTEEEKELVMNYREKKDMKAAKAEKNKTIMKKLGVVATIVGSLAAAFFIGKESGSNYGELEGQSYDYPELPDNNEEFEPVETKMTEEEF